MLASLSLLIAACGGGSKKTTPSQEDARYHIYELAVASGEFTGTYEEWLNTIKGVGIESIRKTAVNGNVDIYTITYTNGQTSTFSVTNGADGEQGIQGEPGKDGHTPTISISNDGYWVIDGEKTSSPARGPKGEDGVGIESITKTSTDGLIDTYTINHYYINDVTLAAGATLQILSSDDVWYSNASTWTGCGFTLENGNVKVTNAGTYNIDFYVVGDNDNHIVLTAQGQPDPEVYTYTINVVIPSGWGISDIYDGGAKVYVWAWGGTYGGGAWVTTTKVSANKLTVDIDDTITAFKVVRLSNTTTTPTWGNKWNESNEIVPSSGVYTYSTTLQ